jgi:hypothetical protein
MINALFLADSLATWLEQGITNVDWWDLHNGVSLGNNAASLNGMATYGDYGILSDGRCLERICPAPADTPYPTYYALQMLAAMLRPGSRLLAASSSTQEMAVHATRQPDGRIALLLVNKEGHQDLVAISLQDATTGSSGTITTYAPADNTPITTGREGLGTQFTLSVPAYSLTTIVLAPSSS